MILLIARLFGILNREKRVELKPGVRYLATLDMTKVKPGLAGSDVKNWLMKVGFSPTTRPDMWKVKEEHLSRLPRAAVLKAEVL